MPGGVRAGLQVWPHAEVAKEDEWWVVSDLRDDVRAGKSATNYVLGIGAAATTLRRPVAALPRGRGPPAGELVITADQTWEERLGGWLAGSGCDAWV